MATYRVHFVDHGDNIYLSQDIERLTDEEAIAAVHRINSAAIGAGFEIWEGDRLVHRHRNLRGGFV